jgi:hypothetical protein
MPLTSKVHLCAPWGSDWSEGVLFDKIFVIEKPQLTNQRGEN